ncbi:MAG: carbohydrate kinase [Candidatus Raymondbacteria bacterium RifOxyA12_full_50_37]|nr:MAG: carbohydrate kinase [Candidatus Raymondbacteria bacterium RifOxyA12_full_50_37]OGJ91133.1 MAG: carbohydrate kinase [Candidatus Raymondbacteria bacterium RIFOXYA2_FULL_49_16]OGJ97531.1 MAG: carbohydrate kinase [Candidatus Raymondbacteria bacterium RIFOXYC2_FULL_50_21]OGK00165.1 MAG: carbohydrate kinase [Candidatus Raymondbacteria bacterium RifOxyB12_full_50_8]OGK06796.1 MAG: carbohydrate kinase [Candidatus Raymondbacteria bacterium RifOxyC12_full_50_8]OGP44360.1 MAG: carbohydrate kinase
MFLLGLDIGSSSVKASLVDAATGAAFASATSPKTELPIVAPKPGWAEQDPATWWKHVKNAIREILVSSKTDTSAIAAIGISYQMHGLVIVDRNMRVLRPAIIWCDSRAVETGEKAFKSMGPKKCLERFLNSPGNFTASKLKWVQQNEPKIYKQIYKMMLPGDYIAMKMTSKIKTTYSGLSEGILWDFKSNGLAQTLLSHYKIAPELIADPVPSFSQQGELTKQAAEELGLKTGTPITYRGGDQPNNALSLNVLSPGEIATTAGTSGVIYGVTDKLVYDPLSRVNTFVHINHSAKKPRYGVLLCINGTGILNSWLKHTIAAHKGSELTYPEMNDLAAATPIGADGLVMLPYGNGAERSLGNKDLRAAIHGLNFPTHKPGHLFRAAQEGIVFALNYGLSIMRGMGMKVRTVRAGHANIFLSPLFCDVFAAMTGATVELCNTDGAQGAARGAGIGAGIYKNTQEAFAGLRTVRRFEPDKKLVKAYGEVYETWLQTLKKEMTSCGYP